MLFKKRFLWILLLFGIVLFNCRTFTDVSPKEVSIDSESSSSEINPTASKSVTDIQSESPAENPTQLPPATLPPASIPNVSSYYWSLVSNSGLVDPLDLVHAGDASGRLFIAEQGGRIKVLYSDSSMPALFLDLHDRAIQGDYEQGLLGLAFHPRYAQNGYFFVNYTDANGDTLISRFQVSADPNIANPDSEFILLQVTQPYSNHNGGGLAFGPDGYLYIGLGDGGSGGDPQGNGQSLNTLLGKLLRIDIDNGDPYAIPPDNPFLSGASREEIWAYGLRNPWRFSFDLITGDLYIADVGQNRREEVNYLPAGILGGSNFGWNYMEGFENYQGEQPENLLLLPPVVDYSHDFGCSITGGYVYRGSSLPEWQGVYFYSDFCTGNVWGMIQTPDGSWESQLIFPTGFGVSSFGQDESGEIYLVDHRGAILRLKKK